MSYSSLSVRTTWTMIQPVLWEGDTHSISEADITRESALTGPNLHSDTPCSKPCPRTSTTVPPRSGPNEGIALEYTCSSGIAETVTWNGKEFVPCSVSTLKIMKAFSPTGWAGVLHSSAVADKACALENSSPNLHNKACSTSNPCPVIVTLDPPHIVSEDGTSDVTYMSDMYWKRTKETPKSTPLLLTSKVTFPTPRDGGTVHSTALLLSNRAFMTLALDPILQTMVSTLSKCWPSTVTVCDMDPTPRDGLTLET